MSETAIWGPTGVGASCQQPMYVDQAQAEVALADHTARNPDRYTGWVTAACPVCGAWHLTPAPAQATSAKP